MGDVVDIGRRQSISCQPTLEAKKLEKLLADLRDAVERMNKVDAELVITQKKLAIAQKRAQWAKRGIENLRVLCIGYIKSECQLDKVKR